MAVLMSSDRLFNLTRPYNIDMGNELEKEYGIKEKPLKLPGSYNFLRFIHHPNEDLSLLVVKAPHRATRVPSTLILPIK